MSQKFLKVDLHMHSHYSKDSFNSFPDIIRTARRRGMDVICLTDHNTADGALRLRDISPIPVIVGEEIATATGEVLGYFLEKTIPPRMSTEDTIAAIREQNGIAIISHPADSIRKEAMRRAGVMSVIDQVDGLEVFNSRCLLPRFNLAAAELARVHQLPGTAGSDAHTLGEIANAFVEIPYFTTRDEFLANLPRAIIHGRLTLPTVHFATALAKRIKRLRPSLYGSVTSHT
jgi:predicted metal-dependent phosphoesterase TrpH